MRNSKILGRKVQSSAHCFSPVDLMAILTSSLQFLRPLGKIIQIQSDSFTPSYFQIPNKLSTNVSSNIFYMFFGHFYKVPLFKKCIQLEDNCNTVLLPATYPRGSYICPLSLESLFQLPSHPSRLSQGRKYHFKELLWEFKQIPEISGKCLTIVAKTVSPSK